VIARPASMSMRTAHLITALALVLICLPRLAFGWGHEGHVVIALIAEHYMTPAALKDSRELLDGESIDAVASWADEYRRENPETGAWHYIDIPLSDSGIDMTRECPNGDCVIAKTEHFLAVLRDASADRSAKAEALKFVVHFVGDLHQPLHDEDDHDKGGNARRVIFDGYRDNLHWVWDTGLLRDINRNAKALAAELKSRITPEDRAQWGRGTVEDWALEGHHLAQTVAYGDLADGYPARITTAYEREADPVIELQLEKAGVRLAYLLNAILK
jgi:hypothetical protein